MKNQILVLLVLIFIIFNNHSQLFASTSITGLIDDKGYDVQAFPFNPDLSEQSTALTSLMNGELTWSILLSNAYIQNPNIPLLKPNIKKILFLKSESETCYIEDIRPFKKVLIFYNKPTNSMIFCRVYFRASELDQNLLFLQELSRFALFVLHEKSAIDQNIVEGFGGIYKDILNSNDNKNLRQSILNLRSYLNQYAPSLITVATEELELGKYKTVEVYKDKKSKVTYPVPYYFFEPDGKDTIPSHFLEYVGSSVWTKYKMFSSDEMKKDVIIKCPFENNLSTSTVCNETFTYIVNGVVERIGVKKEFPGLMPPQLPPVGPCNDRICHRFPPPIDPKNVTLIPISVKRDELSDEFRSYIDWLGITYIRTIQADNIGRVNDYVYKFE